VLSVLVLMTCVHKFHFVFNILFPAPCAEPDFLFKPGMLGLHMDRTFTYGFMPSIAAILCAQMLYADGDPQQTGILPHSGTDRLALAALCFGASSSLSSVSIGHYIVASPFEYSYSLLAHASILSEGMLALAGIPTAAFVLRLALLARESRDAGGVAQTGAGARIGARPIERSLGDAAEVERLISEGNSTSVVGSGRVRSGSRVGGSLGGRNRGRGTGPQAGTDSLARGAPKGLGIHASEAGNRRIVQGMSAKAKDSDAEEIQTSPREF